MIKAPSVVWKHALQFISYLLYVYSAGIVYLFIRLYGHNVRGAVYTSSVELLISTFFLAGFGISLVIFLTNKIFDHINRANRLSVFLAIFFRTITGVLVAVTAVGLTAYMVSLDTDNAFRQTVYNVSFNNPFFVRFLIYLFYTLFILNIIIHLQKRNSISLIQTISGRYTVPQFQKYVFALIDMNDYSQILSRIGEERISVLLQDCFIELDESIAKFGGRIANYMGDTVLVYWPYTPARVSCYLEVLFDFFARIQRKKDYFLSRYRIVPRFKAGCNVGMLTAYTIRTPSTNVFSFLGDTLNIAARAKSAHTLADASAEYSVFVTKQLSDMTRTSHIPHVSVLSMGTIPLKGKKHPQEIMQYKYQNLQDIHGH